MNEKDAKAWITLISAFVNVAVVWWLWNQLATDIFHFRSINYWEAFGLIILFHGFLPFKMRIDEKNERTRKILGSE